MFMLPSLLDMAALTLGSPSKTCKVRVSSTRYRNDPYRAKVCLKKAMASITTASYVEPQCLPAEAFAAMAPTRAPSPVQSLSASSFPSTSSVALPPGPPVVSPLGLPKQHPVLSMPMMQDPVPAQIAPLTPSKLALSADVKGLRYAVIGFKHEAGTFQAPFRVAVGDVVVVEADRGEHIGVVQSLTLKKPAFNVPCRILRRASQQEVNSIDEMTEKEKRVTAKVQRAAEACGLGIRVVDSEFQFDGNKLTVFFASKAFVDFRKLQRTLFREFRTRIWLVNWNEVRLYTPVQVNPV